MITPTLAAPPSDLDHTIFVPMTANTAIGTPAPINLQLQVNERLSWYDPGELGNNYNIIVVMDYSGSMGLCWGVNQACPIGSRRIDHALPSVRTLIHEMLVDRAGAGTDNEMALIGVGFGIGQPNVPATIQVPLTKTVELFWEQIGSPTAPITIPNSQLSGWTPTAHGLALALNVIADGRTVDKNGKPVENIVILVTDGIPNVLIDAPYDGIVNNANGPYGVNTPLSKRGPDWQPCVNGNSATDEPNYQIECPRNHPSVRSPIQATIDYGNAIRQQGASIWALQLPTDHENNPDQTYLSLIADHVASATTPNDVQPWFDHVFVEVDSACRSVNAVDLPATGATVGLYTSQGDLITQTIVPANGLVTFPVEALHEYRISASHLDVIAPNDPLQLPRDYTHHWLLPVQGGAAESQSFFVVGPNQPGRLKAVLVTEQSTQCP